MEWVAGFAWNEWQVSAGLGGWFQWNTQILAIAAKSPNNHRKKFMLWFLIYYRYTIANAIKYIKIFNHPTGQQSYYHRVKTSFMKNVKKLTLLLLLLTAHLPSSQAQKANNNNSGCALTHPLYGCIAESRLVYLLVASHGQPKVLSNAYGPSGFLYIRKDSCEEDASFWADGDSCVAMTLSDAKRYAKTIKVKLNVK